MGRADLNGTGVESTSIPTARSPAGVAIDDKHIYWGHSLTGLWSSSPSSAIGRANLDGSVVDQNIDVPLLYLAAVPTGLAVDGLSTPPPPPPPPSNEVRFGKLEKNERRGTAKLPVNVPRPGELELAQTGRVNADEESAKAAGSEALSIRARGEAKRRLTEEGKLNVLLLIRYTPTRGTRNVIVKRKPDQAVSPAPCVRGGAGRS